MRKVSCKWYVWLTVFAFASPIFYALGSLEYLFYALGSPEHHAKLNITEIFEKLLVAVFITTCVWAVYGIVCLFSRSQTVRIQGQKVLKICDNCAFSERVVQTSTDGQVNGTSEPEDMKCNLTGYNYEKTYTCKKWKRRM